MTEISKISLKKTLISEDGVVKYVYMNSLKNMAMSKIVIKLWTAKNIQNQIIDFTPIILFPGMSRACWKELENKVIQNVSELPVAKPLQYVLRDIVPAIGEKLYKWIMYYDNHLFKNLKTPENSASLFINNIDWDVRRGNIDCAKSARNILANQSTSLDEDQKYKLACDCCLEDEIPIIAPKVVQPPYLNSVSIDEFPMVHYWTAKMTGDYTTIHSVRRDRREGNIYGVIMKKLIGDVWTDYSRERKCYNGVPLQYIWKELSDGEKLKSIESIMLSFHSAELKLFTLSTLNCEQQRNVLKRFCEHILIDILNDWRWREYFLSLSFHILDFVDPEEYFPVLMNILDHLRKTFLGENMCMYNEYKSLFMTIWFNAPNRLRDCLVDCVNGEESVIYSIFDIPDIAIRELILKEVYAKKNKWSPLTESDVIYCSFLLLNWKWEILELFIMFNLFPQKYLNRNHIKERTIEQKCDEFVEGDFIDDVLSNRKLRLNSNYIRCLYLFRLLSRETKADFGVLKYHFEWCFKKKIETTDQIYEYFPEFAYWLLIICKLVEEENYELIYEKLNM